MSFRHNLDIILDIASPLSFRGSRYGILHPNLRMCLWLGFASVGCENGNGVELAWR